MILIEFLLRGSTLKLLFRQALWPIEQCNIVNALTQPGRRSINSLYKSLRSLTAYGTPLSVNKSTEYQTNIYFKHRPLNEVSSHSSASSSLVSVSHFITIPVWEWQIKPSHRYQTLYDAPFKNTQRDGDKFEGKGTQLASDACNIGASVNTDGMWEGNPNQVDMRRDKTLTNPSGFFIYSMLSCF